jgi:hypothetical protein
MMCVIKAYDTGIRIPPGTSMEDILSTAMEELTALVPSLPE